MNRIIKYFKSHGVALALTLGSILVVAVLHWIGIFDIIELKTYDFRFHGVRGPLTGWRAADSTYIKMGTDIVLVEVDDEAYRLMPSSNPKWNEWPYPRVVWAKTIEYLSKAGAKVIAFDIQFDSPKDGDEAIAQAIEEARKRGTTVILSAKVAKETTRIPPQYLANPSDAIMRVDPEIGVINDLLDEDLFSRQYQIFTALDHEPEKALMTIALEAVHAFLGLPDSLVPRFEQETLEWSYGPLKIQAYGATNSFLVNYYGPPSGYKIPSSRNLPAWGTFPRYSLAYIIDTDEVELSNPEEDIDWMNQFIPGSIPEWIEAIEDPAERQEMISMMGLGTDFDITSSPFYNKIVVIGVAVEVLHDTKSTPFYNYFGLQQLTPGMETHANAMQTILHNNYIHVFGNRLTELRMDNNTFTILLSHSLLTGLLSLLAFVMLSFMNPVWAGILVFFEGIIYFGIACGLFTNDLFWMLRFIGRGIFPEQFIIEHGDLFYSALPAPGEGLMIPIVAPVAGILVTYTSNVIYKFIVEQRDKKFLKSTFGTYISPDLIDQMYEQKQQPKLGGESGYHTAFFSDIQSFSSFSEVLEPEKMVSLMNQYLTEMTTILLDHRGTLDKYIGDAIVAFWGAPMPVDDQEYLTCMAALKMSERLGDLRERWHKEGDWPDIVCAMQHRIGLNAGEMVTGNMGSEMRMNYTMMGDTVNLAARLESSAKQYGVYIQVAERIYEATKDRFEYRFLDNVRVKGKTIPVKTYELLAEKGKLSDRDQELIDIFHKGQKHYFAQRWDDALTAFRKAEKLEDMFPGRSTNPSRVYIARCEQLKENPPGDDWDGVWTLTAK